ncbi:MAG: 2,4-dihydroxyhept-2-ene-1,7-dioic acid aldolase [Lachnospiraceae bacterium]|nr:2,4-dihydroxyhept-2-ene-1,7-dioic acid aldolase [Lachnospiraceae bacterium]
MKENLLRSLLNEKRPTVSTRIRNIWPTEAEAAAQSGSFDYLEFTAEYAPYDLLQLENLVRACELHGIGSMIKLDLQNRFYVAQKAMAVGFQALLFADHKTPDEVAESIRLTMPDTPEDGGRFGYPSNRWIGYQPFRPQMEYADMVRKTVRAFMVEKKEMLDNLEEICSIPGVDMVQFGPSDYSMSMGWNRAEHREELKEAEQKMIRIALDHGVAPRCEIDTAEQVAYYKELGVRHFSVGDDFRVLASYWKDTCGTVRDLARNA